MKLAVLLPVKPMHLAKSRLSPVMNLEEREALVRSGLVHTLQELLTLDCAMQIFVISADPLVWQIARQYEVEVLQELDVPGLNESLQAGLAFVAEKEVDAVMIVPVDLPRLTAERLQKKIACLRTPGMVIVPDRHLTGTNLLLCAPPNLIPPAFGAGSMEAHCQLARAAGVEPVIMYCPDLGLDIDSPEDLSLVV